MSNWSTSAVIHTFHTEGPPQPTVTHNAQVRVLAIRDEDPSRERALIKVCFNDGAAGPAGITLRFTPAEFKDLADSIQQRRIWLGV